MFNISCYTIRSRNKSMWWRWRFNLTKAVFTVNFDFEVKFESQLIFWGNIITIEQLLPCDRSRDGTWSNIDKISIRQFSGEEAAQFAVLLSGLPKSENWKMAKTLTSYQATKEHVLAVSRDFISQPRLSEYT